MDEVDRCIATLKPDSWKGYTVGDNTNKDLARHPWRMDDEKLVYPFYEKIVKECGKRNLYPGIHCSGAEGAVRAINMGFKLVTLSNESGLMMTYAKMQVNQTRKDSGGKA